MAAVFAKPKSFTTFLWLYFFTGLILGLIIGCAVTLMFAFSSLTVTNYYYYYDGKTYQIHNTLPQVISNGKIIKGKLYGPSSSSPYPKLKDEFGGTWYDVQRLSEAHSYVRGFPVVGVAVVLFVGQRCDILNDQKYLELWGSSASLFLIINSSKCTVKNSWKDRAKLWNLTIYYYTYTKDNGNVHQLLYTVHSSLTQFHHWIALITPDTYLNILNMNRLLDRFNSNDHHMFGVSDNTGKYCLENGQVLLLSRTVLDNLMLTSKDCLDVVRNSPVSLLTAVSQCCVDILHMYCSSQLKIVNDFKEDRIDYFPSLSNFTNILALYPTRNSHVLHELHRHFVTAKYNNTRRQLDSLSSIISRLANHSIIHQESFLPHQYPLQVSIANEIRWDYFDNNFFYNDRYLDARCYLEEHKNELNTVLLEIVRLANIDYHVPLVFNRIINGYMTRTEDGTRYIIDAELQEIYTPHATLRRRFSLLRPFRLNYVSFSSKSVIDEVVHMIVPIHEVGVRLIGFFKTYENLINDLKDHIHLIMVVYNQKDTKQCKEFVKKYQSGYPMLTFTIVQGKGQFSRARALDAGTAILNNTDLMFFCDVDLDIGVNFFERCKLNTILGKQVYYPEVFKMYNMDYVYRYGTKPLYYDTVRKHGHWGYYGYGMVCMYKSDYVKVGGLDTSYIGWGGEDLEFHSRVSRKGYGILRAPDPALKHPWHKKVCDLSDKSKQSQCLGSQSEVLADRAELGRYVYELEKNKSHLFCI